MLAAMPEPLFREWTTYAALEPFGETRADLRAGIIASVYANANRKKNSRAFKPKDFMPTWGPSRQSTDDMIEQATRAAKAAQALAGKG